MLTSHPFECGDFPAKSEKSKAVFHCPMNEIPVGLYDFMFTALGLFGTEVNFLSSVPEVQKDGH